MSLSSRGTAATTFSSGLTSLPSQLEIADPDGNGPDDMTNAVTFSASGATFTNRGNDGRNYIRTTDTDYSSGNFRVEVTWDGSGISFFGYGGGNVGTFGTPDWDIADSLWPEITGNNAGPVSGVSPGRFGSNLTSFDGNVLGGNPVRLRMIYDMEANSIQWFADNNYNGTFAADVQTGVLDIGATAAGANFLSEPGDETRFYFGGQGGTYSDFEITAVPEPTTPLLIGITGTLALLRRRKG